MRQRIESSRLTGQRHPQVHREGPVGRGAQPGEGGVEFGGVEVMGAERAESARVGDGGGELDARDPAPNGPCTIGY
ncbi:2-nitropropane dioxygenase domain protein [Rhodococcus sp. MTM3W5.2]|nr:2-nitropropane dioxygenase domain protein [Rhodococcus sp. MTM3W5.2]